MVLILMSNRSPNIREICKCCQPQKRVASMCLLRVKNEPPPPRGGGGRPAEVPLGRAESGAAGAGIRLPARARGLHNDLSLGVLHIGLAAADGGHPGSAVRNHFGVPEHAAPLPAPARG